MRFEIARGGSGLTYDIRGIVPLANKFKEFGLEIIWENIGDPVPTYENIPAQVGTKLALSQHQVINPLITQQKENDNS